MFTNYLKTAWRNLFRNKTFSLINILGLALGMTCSILVMLWIQDEKSIDRFAKNGDRLLNIYERSFNNGETEAGRSTPGLMADEVKRVFPDVKYACGFAWNETKTFSFGDKIIKKEGTYAGADYFNMFSYPVLQGIAADALNSKEKIAISAKMAEELFGKSQSAIGKTILFENKLNFKVSAVFDNLSVHSSQKFDYLINWDAFLDRHDWARDWSNNAPYTYIMLSKDASPNAFEAKLVHFLDHYNKDDKIELGIQPFREIYLHDQFKNGRVGGGRIEYVRLFSLVAIFILLIACINFMNLTTAYSLKRAREIGIRKVVGAQRAKLILQFIGEAMLLTCLASVISIVLAIICIPAFNAYTGKAIHLPVNQLSFWASLSGLILFTGFIAGSYPALFLSSLQPIRVLKGVLKFSSWASYFRKGLVVFQFVISIVFIVGTLVVSKQLDYVQTMNLGYNRENLLYIPLEGDLIRDYKVFKAKALEMPGVEMVSRISGSPTNLGNGTNNVDWEGKDPNKNPDFVQASIGYDFIKTMGIQFKEGRDFSKSYSSDSSGYIVNQETIKMIGYKNPIGKSLTFWGKKGTIVGVTKDFHFSSLTEPIQPLILRFGESESIGMALIKIEAPETKQVLTDLENLCKQLNPKFPFTYQFSDEEYTKLYKSEQVVGKLSNTFAFLGVFISCLGLLGLATYTAEKRTKEFSIRKVLGANAVSLFTLLSIEFLQLVSVAMFIATPIAWSLMNIWLLDFAYHIPITWWMFLVAGLLAISIALLTVSFHAIKAAIANPVNSLRSE